jgi:pimeloyl-ACP methyl ester carboxylesterase
MRLCVVLQYAGIMAGSVRFALTLFLAASIVAADPPSKLTIRAEDGHPLTVWTKSPRSPRAAILLLHGRTWSALPNFDLQVPGERRSVMDRLRARGYATFALDMRGYGATPRDGSGWLTPHRASDDVATVLRWIAANAVPRRDKPYLLGYSRGSVVAHLCAQRFPEILSGLVLFGYGRDPDLNVPVANEPADPARLPNTTTAAASDFRTPTAISRIAVVTYVKQALRTDPVKVDWRYLHEFNELDPHAIKVPTLIIQGEHDPIAPTAIQAKLYTRLGTPDRMWVTLGQSDHAAHVEDSQHGFVHAVISFIQAPRK